MSYERNARAALAALRLDPKKHLPDEGTAATTYTIPSGKHTGIELRVMVLAKSQVAPRKHRLYAECPRCGNAYTVGNIQQHLDACLRPQATDPLSPNQKNG